ncbi:hypothetical protein [Crateriforma spongiae]|uniref:hypothetical protein n=1 Tax=Crateriforma spongiae TaxID=2724528 RepID=UPI0014464D0D|nr:hypothetical protein [Crateriforma spongiae]
MTNPTWQQRVADYAERLAEINESIDLILDETRVGTVNVKSEELKASQDALSAQVQNLQNMLAEREELLAADDAVGSGTTLRARLMSTRRIDDARLAKRLDEVGRQIEVTRERSVALFVCQYHLANLGQELIRLLSGSTGGDTYGHKIGKPDTTERGRGGGLFNEAA